jgi:hypothetical protein
MREENIISPKFEYIPAWRESIWRHRIAHSDDRSLGA